MLCWRKPPVNQAAIGVEARKTEPYIRQLFVTLMDETRVTDAAYFERQLFMLRKQATHLIPRQCVKCYICSLSPRTIVYKVSTRRSIRLSIV